MLPAGVGSACRITNSTLLHLSSNFKSIPNIRRIFSKPQSKNLSSLISPNPWTMSPPIHGNFFFKSSAILDDDSSSTTKFVKPQDLGSSNNLSVWLSARMQGSPTAWGIEPGTKNVTNLWIELLEGETTLEDTCPPKRTVHVACVNIRNPKGCILVESHQELGDGSVRIRNRPLSEKMKAEESVEAACLRGINEELGSALCGGPDDVDLRLDSYKREVKERDAESYPGLLTCYVVHSVDAVVRGLPEGDFLTEEDEEGRINGGGGDSCERRAIGVSRHFWKWIPETNIL